MSFLKAPISVIPASKKAGDNVPASQTLSGRACETAEGSGAPHGTVTSGVLFGELTLPRRGADAKALADGIAFQQGRVVFEILSKKSTPQGVSFRYRALPLAAWQGFVSSPSSPWPLIPEEIKLQRRTRFNHLVEVVSLYVLGFILAAGIIYEAFQLNALKRYANSLKSVKPTSSFVQSAPLRFANSRGVQWAQQLNTIVEAISPVGGQVASFEFSSDGQASVSLSFPSNSPADPEALLSGVLHKNIVQVKEGVWSWRE